MRRATSPLPSPVSLLAGLTASAVLCLGVVGPAHAGGSDEQAIDTPRPVGVSLSDTERTLDRAASALEGRPPSGSDERVEATLALRDLFVARRSLGEDDVREADRLLARPTDGASDPYGDGYTTSETKACAAHVCVHWVRSGADAPPDDAWAKKTLSVMEQVWKHHIGTLGYRKPAGDGSRGGNGKFDVYLKELGGQGLYGYCAPEGRVPGKPKQASGFCVLDDDFAASQFNRPPIESLRVTAAHEFFHAIQFAYDYTEDPWLLESTATWIEERFADDVNDNRNYLKYGQAGRSKKSLDLFDPSGLAHYGNWVFWEFLSERYGNAIVRKVIERTGTGGGLPDDYSTQALRKVLKRKGGLPKVYAAFAAANTHPKGSYEEGAHFPGIAPVKKAALRSADPRVTFATKVNHLAAKTVKFKPAKLKAKKWQLKVKVRAPGSATAPAASVLVVRDNGTLQRRPITLDKRGKGSRTLAFSSRKVRAVTVTVANASTRYSCNTGSGFACEGRPLDQREAFKVTAEAVRG
ncbi:hypothetical protein BH09ACT12_BH09ACT12_22210 [soil metagenome]